MTAAREVARLDFYLGVHRAGWLARINVPLFLSHRILGSVRRLPRALAPWALDSGGFSELSMHGRWTVTPFEYAAAVRRYRDEIGSLDWAAVQDWMCEPDILRKTGLTVAEHQRRTLRSLLDLQSIAPEVRWLPVLQGWERADYLRHAEMYERAGIELRDFERVGLGSVCRRQATRTAQLLVATFAASYGYRVHGFGMKTAALRNLAGIITSADSMAWSYAARRAEEPHPYCEKASCRNCLHYALEWRATMLESFAMPWLYPGRAEEIAAEAMRPEPAAQGSLFEEAA